AQPINVRVIAARQYLTAGYGDSRRQRRRWHRTRVGVKIGGLHSVGEGELQPAQQMERGLRLPFIGREVAMVDERGIAKRQAERRQAELQIIVIPAVVVRATVMGAERDPTPR